MKKVKSHTSHSFITAEHLVRKMNIGLENSKQMMRATTQKYIQTAVHPITRRYRVDHLDLHTARFAGNWHVYQISTGTKSLAQNAGYFVLSNGTFTTVYPSDSKQQMPSNISLNDFCNNVKFTENLKIDRDPLFCGRNFEFLKSDKRKVINLTYAEPKRKNQIAPIGVEIREIRKRTHNKMKQTNMPGRLWDY